MFLNQEVKELFDQYPAIFIPQDPNITDWKANQETPVQGQFVHKKCAYWNDPTELLQKQLDKAGKTESFSLSPSSFILLFVLFLAHL